MLNIPILENDISMKIIKFRLQPHLPVPKELKCPVDENMSLLKLWQLFVFVKLTSEILMKIMFEILTVCTGHSVRWTLDSSAKLEQLERLRSEDTPRRLMITHTIESYGIPSQNESRKIRKISEKLKF